MVVFKKRMASLWSILREFSDQRHYEENGGYFNDEVERRYEHPLVGPVLDVTGPEWIYNRSKDKARHHYYGSP